MEFSQWAGGRQVLPLSRHAAQMYVVWAVRKRVPPLDTSSVETFLSGIAVWHRQFVAATRLHDLDLATRCPELQDLMPRMAKVYKKPSEAKHPLTAQQYQNTMYRGFDCIKIGGLHHRLLVTFLGGGPFRINVAVSLRVHYTVIEQGGQLLIIFRKDSQVWIDENLRAVGVSVSKDKNVDATNRRNQFIPDSYMGINIVSQLRHYLLWARPPSGARLLSCPISPLRHVAGLDMLGPRKFREKFFNDNPFTNASSAVKVAVGRGNPELSKTELMRYGSGTPRKTFAEIHFAAGINRDVIRDGAGWRKKQTETLDGYCHTKDHQRCAIMRSLQMRLELCGELAPGTTEMGALAPVPVMRAALTWVDEVGSDSEDEYVIYD